LAYTCTFYRVCCCSLLFPTPPLLPMLVVEMTRKHRGTFCKRTAADVSHRRPARDELITPSLPTSNSFSFSPTAVHRRNRESHSFPPPARSAATTVFFSSLSCPKLYPLAAPSLLLRIPKRCSSVSGQPFIWLRSSDDNARRFPPFLPSQVPTRRNLTSSVLNPF